LSKAWLKNKYQRIFEQRIYGFSFFSGLLNRLAYQEKIMNYNYLLLAVIAFCLAASFLKINKIQAANARMKAISVIDEYIEKAKNKSHTDADLLEDEDEIALNSHTTPGNSTRIGADGSEINTMTDRYGNKTQTRCFDYHPRINCIMLSTGAEGQKKVFVYAQNGDVKDLPEEMLSKVMTADADEIANAAGIILTPQRTLAPTFTQTIKPEKFSPNQPSPGSQLSTQPIEPKANEETKTSRPASENNLKSAPAANDNNSPKANSEILIINPQPEEK
jgi:hypothetical protein